MTDSALPELSGIRDVSPWDPERLAGLWPGRDALVDSESGARLTYANLRDRAASLAAGLARLGTKRGERVVAICGNGIHLVELLFACSYLGAILVPLNWRLSARELGEQIDDVEPRVIIVGPEYVEMTEGIAGEAIIVGLDPQSEPCFDDLFSAKPDRPPADVRMDDPWLILYTGGTTGTPKGAVLTHGSITWNSINTGVSWGLSEADTGPVLTPGFHTGFWNVFLLPLLLLGGRVILGPRFDPGNVLRMLEAERPTILFMVPTMFQMVAEDPAFDAADLSNLRWAISGGAPLPEPVYDRWKKKVRVFKQGYGLTEVGPNNFATPDSDAGRKPGTVGRLTYFARARIVDDSGDDVPDGSPGELLLAGPHMCAGYWRRPEATAAAIQDGWFHTGDIARRDAEDFYYIVDRKKDMILSGGENIYPIEVERVLYEHPVVREVAVVGLPDPTWGESVAAVVSLHSGQKADEEELRAYTRDHIARYKVPKRFLFVDDLPKSGAGKIVRAEARALAIREFDQ